MTLFSASEILLAHTNLFVHDLHWFFFQIKRSQIRKGMVMVSPAVNPSACWEFEGEILVLHHPTTISSRYQAMGKLHSSLLIYYPNLGFILKNIAWSSYFLLPFQLLCFQNIELLLYTDRLVLISISSSCPCFSFYEYTSEKSDLYHCSTSDQVVFLLCSQETLQSQRIIGLHPWHFCFISQ